MNNGRQAIAAMTGLAEGINKGVENFLTIQKVKQELDQRKKTFEIDTRIKGLELKKLEQELDPSVFREKQEQFKLETKAKKANLELTQRTIEAKESEIKRQTQKQSAELNLMDRMARGEEINLAPGIKFKGDILEISGPKQEQTESFKTKDVVDLAKDLAKSEMSVADRQLREPTSEEISGKLEDATRMMQKAAQSRLGSAGGRKDTSESDKNGGAGGAVGKRVKVEINNQIMTLPEENLAKAKEAYPNLKVLDA